LLSEDYDFFFFFETVPPDFASKPKITALQPQEVNPKAETLVEMGAVCVLKSHWRCRKIGKPELRTVPKLRPKQVKCLPPPQDVRSTSVQ
jgi:hypothetical protein